MNTKTKTIIAVIVIFILTGVVVGYYLKQKNKPAIPASSTENIEQPVAKENPVAENQPQEPQKTDFGTSMPTDFPTDIPIEKGATVQQSYGLDYAGQKQLSIVFLSAKTVKEDYSLYADFLSKQGWNVVNKYEDEKLSSLYGTKESNEINVTINENVSSTTTESQVSISVLKK